MAGGHRGGRKSGDIKAGSAGHGGQDRQPVSDAAAETRGSAPEGRNIATPGQVRRRSAEARKSGNAKRKSPDQVKPGRGRMM